MKKPKLRFVHQTIELRVVARYGDGEWASRDRILVDVRSDISHLKTPKFKELQSCLYAAKIEMGRLLAKRRGGAGTKRNL